MLPHRVTTSAEAMMRRGVTQRVRLAGLRLAGRFYAGSRDVDLAPLRTAGALSILLIRPDHLGDLLFLTPGLRLLREALPEARLVLLAGPWGAEAMRGNPDLDEVKLCEFPGFERRAKKSLLAPYLLLLRTARELQAVCYDVAVVLRCDHWWGAWLAAAAGVPHRLGYDWPETRPFLTRALPYEPGRHEVRQNTRLLSTLIPAVPVDPGPLRYQIAAEDEAWAAGWLASHAVDFGRPVVAVHPGAGSAVKQWPPAAWAMVGDQLAREFDAHILLTGGPNERDLTAAVQAHMAQPALDVAGQTSLGQLAALQARCTLVLGSDSGPLHLAVAAGARTIHLYGPVGVTTFGPWGSPTRQQALVSPWSCVPCNRLDWSHTSLSYHQCMAMIAPGQVVAAARQVLQG